MDTKQLEFQCPCCRTRLVVDVRTGAVLRSARPEETDEAGKPVMRESDWTAAVDKVRERGDGAGSKLDAALQKEREKSSRLDELFNKASSKLKDSDAG